MSHGVDGMRKRNRILFIFFFSFALTPYHPNHFCRAVFRLFALQFESVSYRLLVDSTVKVNDFLRRFCHHFFSSLLSVRLFVCGPCALGLA